MERIKKGLCILAVLLLTAIAMVGCESLSGAESSFAEGEPSQASVGQKLFDENETFWDISFTLQPGSNAIQIKYWGNGDGLYYYFLPSGCGTDALSVHTLHGITLRRSDTEEPMLLLKDGDTLAGIECNTKYMLGCYDINNYHYETPVVFMQGANIPAMFITTQSGSIAGVLEDKSVKEPGSMLLIDENAQVAYEGDLKYIKGHGNGSWWSVKRPFNIKLAQASDLLGMGTAKKWCLLNHHNDATFLRNKLAFDLAKQTGLNYEPDSEYIDLWIDGEYYGLYLLSDRIDISEGSVDISDLDDATEAVNLDELSDYPVVIDEKLDTECLAIPNNPEDITGGYLIEIDKFYASDKASKFAAASLEYVTLKSPEFASKEQLAYIRNLVLKMEKAIRGTGSSYKKYIDMSSWSKMCVMQEVLGNSDFMGSSQYFYKEADVDGKISPIYAGPIWDMNYSLGNKADPNYIPPNVLTITSRSWMHHLYARSEFYDLMVREYAVIYRPLLGGLIARGIDQYADRIRSSAQMDFTRWPKRNYTGTVTELFSENVQELKQYMTERVAFFDDLWVNKVDFCTVTITTETKIHSNKYYYSLDYMVSKGEALGNIADPIEQYGYIFDGWAYGTPSAPGKAYEPNAPVTNNTKVYAKYIDLLSVSAEDLEAMGYTLSGCERLDLYLRLLDKENYTVIMALADRGGRLLGTKHISALNRLGIMTNINDLGDNSYYSVASNGIATEANAPNASINYSGQLCNGTPYTLLSDCVTGQGKAELIVDGKNVFVNEPGLNIAVFDDSSGTPVLVDSVCFNLRYNLICTR